MSVGQFPRLAACTIRLPGVLVACGGANLMGPTRLGPTHYLSATSGLVLLGPPLLALPPPLLLPSCWTDTNAININTNLDININIALQIHITDSAITNTTTTMLQLAPAVNTNCCSTVFNLPPSCQTQAQEYSSAARYLRRQVSSVSGDGTVSSERPMISGRAGWTQSGLEPGGHTGRPWRARVRASQLWGRETRSRRGRLGHFVCDGAQIFNYFELRHPGRARQRPIPPLARP